MLKNNRLCKILEIEYPIIQGPMSHISTPSLVAAISENGGLGVLGWKKSSLKTLKKEIKEIKKMTKKNYGINIILLPNILEEVTQLILKEKPPVIYTSCLENIDLEVVRKYFSIWQNEDIKVICKVKTMTEALIIEALGADVIILKGWEGGGQVSYETTMVLVPQAIDCLSVPIVASGGIADGRGMAAAIALGADGIEVGTAFMCSKEAEIHENAKQLILETENTGTIVTGYSKFNEYRFINNDYLNTLINPKYKFISQKSKKKLNKAIKKGIYKGDINQHGVVMSGQCIPLITKIESVKMIIEKIIKSYNKTVKRMEEMN